MVKILTYKTAMGRKIKVPCYNERWRFATYDYEGKRIAKVMREVGFDALDYILDEIKKAQQEAFDRTILLTGDERVGKSTIAAHIATKLGFSDPRQVAWSSQVYYNKLKEAEDRSVTWYDEAARGLYSRDAMKRMQTRLVKAFTQIGIKKLANIMCLPHRLLLDFHMRERRIHYWGNVVTCGYRRGYVEWAIPVKNRWYIQAMWEPLFAMHFPKFRESNGFKWDEYEVLKRAALTEYFEEKEEDGYKRVIPNLAKVIQSLKGQGKTTKEIAEMSGLSEPTIYRYLNLATA